MPAGKPDTSTPSAGSSTPKSAGRPALILASTSPYRRMLLQRLHLTFQVMAPHTDESVQPGEHPQAVALRLALAKARAIATVHPEAVVIGSDQTASLDGIETIGKPGNHERARAQLRQMSGRMLTFYSALAVVHDALGYARVESVETVIRFRQLSDAMIERYLALEPAYDCAGSAKAEGLGISLMASFESPDPTAIVGLPLITLTTMLAQAGIDVLGQPDASPEEPTP